MSDLVVIAFPTEAKAEEVRQKLLAMQKEYLLELGDAVIAVKDAQGGIKLNQLINTTAVGAVSGAFWGTLIGLIFLMPLAGAALGAASGAIGGALSDAGLNDKWMKETAAAIQPGTAALFVLVRKVTADKVLEGLKGEGGTVMKTSLDHTKEAALQAALAGVQAAVPASLLRARCPSLPKTSTAYFPGPERQGRLLPRPAPGGAIAREADGLPEAACSVCGVPKPISRRRHALAAKPASILDPCGSQQSRKWTEELTSLAQRLRRGPVHRRQHRQAAGAAA